MPPTLKLFYVHAGSDRGLKRKGTPFPHELVDYAEDRKSFNWRSQKRQLSEVLTLPSLSIVSLITSAEASANLASVGHSIVAPICGKRRACTGIGTAL